LSVIGQKADQDIARISTHDVLDFQKSELARVSISSANHALKVLKSAFRDAFREGLIHTNPAERVPPAKRQKASIERRPFTIPRNTKTLEPASFEWQGLILFGYLHCQRLSDLARLTSRNLDFSK
jgi:integrase